MPGRILGEAEHPLSNDVALNLVGTAGDGRAFDTPDNAAVILGADGSAVDVPLSSKDAVAHAVWDAVAARLHS